MENGLYAVLSRPCPWAPETLYLDQSSRTAHSLLTGALAPSHRTEEVPFPSISLTLLPLPPSAEKKCSPTLCAIDPAHGAGGICTLLYNLGCAVIHSLNQQLFTKHPIEARCNEPVGHPHLSTSSAAVPQSLPHFKSNPQPLPLGWPF